MNRRNQNTRSFSDDDNHQVWENMRIEVLHELQNGASADVPDAELDNIGNLIVELASWQARKKRNKLAVIQLRKKQLVKVLK